MELLELSYSCNWTWGWHYGCRLWRELNCGRVQCPTNLNTTAEGYGAPPISFYMSTVSGFVVLFQNVNVTSTKQYQDGDPAKYRLHTFCKPPFNVAEFNTVTILPRIAWYLNTCICVCVCHHYTRHLTKKLKCLSDQPLPLL